MNNAREGKNTPGLTCPCCGAKLPYANAKTNIDKTVRIWRRLCRGCGAQIIDTGVFTRECIMPGRKTPPSAP